MVQMVVVDIPKEIQQENKVVLFFTMRQLVCVSVAAVLCFAIAVVFDMNFEVAVIPCMVIGVIAFAFGWVKQDGLTMERLVVKYLQKAVYGNHMRRYRTKNRYVLMMNREYARHREMDEGNRRVMREEKKARKKMGKEYKRKKLKAL